MKGYTLMMLLLLVGLLVLTIISIYNSIIGSFIFVEEYKKDYLPSKIAQLPEIDLKDIRTYNQYRNFADKINSLILILNRELGVKIPLLDTTEKAWNEISKKIKKYTPLINNYQKLIESAKKFEKEKTKENYKEFYRRLGQFSLESTIISTILFHTITFNTVGYLYRASGLNIMAFKCPTCVSIILSNVYWSLKTYLVGESSKMAESLINNLEMYINRG